MARYTILNGKSYTLIMAGFAGPGSQQTSNQSPLNTRKHAERGTGPFTGLRATTQRKRTQVEVDSTRDVGTTNNMQTYGSITRFDDEADVNQCDPLMGLWWERNEARKGRDSGACYR